ncbi:MAG: DNA repair protein RadA [Nitrospinota bacterium]|nr:MAG: DNA repair protein RadA [Nitrospinota bacterium]
MKKPTTVFVCQTCGYETPRWLGRCPECQEWSSLVEERRERHPRSSHPREERAQPLPITRVTSGAEERIPTHLTELDRVLGGGIVPGSVVLLGGDPGIGKSTLLLQASAGISAQGRAVLYISGEESARQTRMRAERLGVLEENLFILPETSLEEILHQIKTLGPGVVVIDSVQTIYTEQIQSAAGSVSQVREVAAQLIALAKRTGISIFLVGHVTKEGLLAGPRVLEHMVDCVLYFEGERGHAFRILRGVKNRFGSVNEIGVFTMGERGLEEVSNPSYFFLSERQGHTSGSVVVATMEGTRPILVEVQALVSPSSFGLPRRMATGIDGNRLALLVAILEKRIGLHLQGEDIYLNVAGGLRIVEPAADLGVAVAIASSFKNVAIDPHTIFIGEVGLGGEVRGVPQTEFRLREAEKLGFRQAVIPTALREVKSPGGLSITAVKSLDEAFALLF